MNQDNPFSQNHYTDQRDQELISLALNGNRTSLSELVKRHQPYIFNVALKMVNHVEDAEDISQEILVTIVTSLAKYDPGKGKFRTWLYRITVNHFLNLKKQKYEQAVSGFDDFFGYIEQAPNIALSADEEKELSIAIDESKVACMTGMLMCLDRAQRLTYIVGAVFEIDHQIAGEIFAISPDNFRQKLARARKDLHQWMHNRCGLVNDENPCRCPKKTKSFIANGWVSPTNLKWHSHYVHTIGDLAENRLENTLLTVDELYARLYKTHPFKIPQKSDSIIESIINNDYLRDTFRLTTDPE